MPEGLVNPLGLDERTRAYRKSTSSPDPFQEYRQRSLLEKELLFFAYDVFGIPFVDPVSQGAGVRGGQGVG